MIDGIEIEENVNFYFSTNPHRIVGLCRHWTIRSNATIDDYFHASQMMKDPNQHYHLEKGINIIVYVVSYMLTACAPISISPFCKTNACALQTTKIVKELTCN